MRPILKINATYTCNTHVKSKRVLGYFYGSRLVLNEKNILSGSCQINFQWLTTPPPPKKKK